MSFLRVHEERVPFAGIELPWHCVVAPGEDHRALETQVVCGRLEELIGSNSEQVLSDLPSRLWVYNNMRVVCRRLRSRRPGAAPGKVYGRYAYFLGVELAKLRVFARGLSVEAHFSTLVAALRDAAVASWVLDNDATAELVTFDEKVLVPTLEDPPAGRPGCVGGADGDIYIPAAVQERDAETERALARLRADADPATGGTITPEEALTLLAEINVDPNGRGAAGLVRDLTQSTAHEDEEGSACLP